MKLHIVGGFLGAGKTTFIAKAARELAAEGRKVGIVTNDQGKYLVDSLFMDMEGVPRTEVTEGCFCCRYEDFSAKLAAFAGENEPDLIFAETVGSCADVVATVVKPIAQALRGPNLENLGFSGEPTFSVFCDSRLLERRLAGKDLPFSDDLRYLFDKQLEEAGLIIANKSDLVPDSNALSLRMENQFPGRAWRLLSARNDEDIREWIELLDSQNVDLSGHPESVDYELYGRAEASLAWADLVAEFTARDAAKDLGPIFERYFDMLADRIRAEVGPIGHVKAFLGDARKGGKISIVSAGPEGIAAPLPRFDGRLRVLVNLRAEGSPRALEYVLRGWLDDFSREQELRPDIVSLNAFSPSPPSVPKQRIDPKIRSPQ